jgi:glycosyltransferase involved in cell wall biosynthesis
VRILVISSYPPRHCGIGAYARDQVARLRAEGDHVTVLSPLDGEGDVRAEFLGGAAFVTARLTAKPGRFDSVILHFQPALYYPPRDPVRKVLASWRLLRLVRSLRARLAIVIHEADRPIRWRPDYLLLRLAFRGGAILRFHTEAERAAFEDAYAMRARAEIIEHRVSPVGARAGGQSARERLGLSGAPRPVFVCAGFVQPSKGFDRAVRAFAQAGGGSLYLVGSPREQTPENLAYAEDVRSLAGSVEGVTLIDRFPSDEEFDDWVSAADWLVLPYRVSWSSGVLARAHALGTPAIVAAVGGLADQAGPEDVVIRSDDELVAALRERTGSPAGAGPTTGVTR